MLPAHLLEQREAPSAYFSAWGLEQSPRQRTHVMRENLIWFCRHARQPFSEAERLPFSEFEARRRALNELLEREFDMSDM